jgi:NADPH-dependent curcumin reductase CurA
MENAGIVLTKRPTGSVTADCFAVRNTLTPSLEHGDVLVRNIYLSCDPYMRGRMSSSKSYANPFELNSVIPARVVGQVEQSSNSAFSVGDYVWGFLGWEQFTHVAGGVGLHRIDESIRPISHAISVMGMPGLTAWVGMMDIGNPKPGETVFVSAASGAVGQIAGQLARIAGARVVGSVGSEAKRRHVIESLGFDAAFNYREHSYTDALDEHCPDGIDVYFENVGGAALEAVLPRLAIHARIPVCGMISRYNDTQAKKIAGIEQMLGKRAVMTGFIVYDHMHKMAAFLPRMHHLLGSGELKYFEDITTGLESTPAAFIEMLEGGNLGKRLVRISDDASTTVANS